VKVLFIDIETSPNLAWTFELKRAYIGIEAIVEPSRMLCFAACWLDKPDRIEFYSEWKHGHEGMLAAAYRLLSEADVVVHYNGERFDEPRMNQEFAQLGWAPPAPFQRIDLWRTISRRFSLPSQKLDYVLRHFGLGGKQSTGGMRLWIGVMNGVEKDRAKMEEYNRNDVAIMVPLYAKLRPWIVGHPNLNLYAVDGDGDGWNCPTCESSDVQRRGFQRTGVSTYQRYRCNRCGSWSREGKRITGTNLRAVAA
jgi:DNA polymerase elongation subunit (family B)